MSDREFCWGECGNELKTEQELADLECSECRESRQRSLADFLAHGGYHPNTKPLEPHERVWRSKDDLIHEAGQSD